MIIAAVIRTTRPMLSTLAIMIRVNVKNCGIDEFTYTALINDAN